MRLLSCVIASGKSGEKGGKVLALESCSALRTAFGRHSPKAMWAACRRARALCILCMYVGCTDARDMCILCMYVGCTDAEPGGIIC